MFNKDKPWAFIVIGIFTLFIFLSSNALAETLVDAVNQGNLEKVTRLVEEGANVNSRNDMGVTPLHFAAIEGNRTIAEFLILKGADINSQTNVGDTPLLWAVIKDKSELVELFVQKGANIDPRDYKGRTPLALACYGGHGSSRYVKCAEILIQNGADVNAADNDGHTPLFYAIAGKNEHISEMLIKHGAISR